MGRVGGCGQESLGLADIQAGKAAFPEQTARRDDLLVQPVAIATNDHQPGMRNDRRRLQEVIWYEYGP